MKPIGFPAYKMAEETWALLSKLIHDQAEALVRKLADSLWFGFAEGQAEKAAQMPPGKIGEEEAGMLVDKLVVENWAEMVAD